MLVKLIPKTLSNSRNIHDVIVMNVRVMAKECQIQTYEDPILLNRHRKAKLKDQNAENGPSVCA